MRSNGRSGGNFHHVPKCGVRYVADINHDAEAIHFFNNFDAKFTEAIPLFVVVIGGIRDVIRKSVGQGDVTNSAIVKMFQVGEIALNR